MKPTFVLSVLTAVLLPLAAFTSLADEVPKKELLAGQLLDQLSIQKSYDGAFASMSKMQEQMMAGQKMTPDQKTKFQKQMQASMDAAKTAMSWESIKPIFVKIYADNFDEAELNGLIAFYKTPVGQTWIEKQPVIQAATMQEMAKMMPKIQAAIMKSMDTGKVGSEGATSSPVK